MLILDKYTLMESTVFHFANWKLIVLSENTFDFHIKLFSLFTNLDQVSMYIELQ